jgi:hypothetical protein
MSDTTVTAAPFVAVMQPYLTAIATALVSGAITLGAAAVRKWTGYQIDATNLAAIKAAAETEAGKAVAAADSSFATAKIEVGSKIVQDAADAIARRMPAVIQAAGISPAEVEQLVAGEIGKLQATMVAVAPDLRRRDVRESKSTA